MKRGKKIALLLFVGLPALCCLGPIAYLQWQVYRTGSDLDRELERARRMRVPVTPADMVRHVPDERNAAVYYKRAIELTKERPEVLEAMRSMSGFSSRAGQPIRWSDFAGAVEKVEPVLRLVEQGAALPEADFHRDYSQGIHLAFPEYVDMRNWSRVLAVKARIQSDRGDWRGALRTIETIGAIGRHIGQDRFLIAMLVKVANESIALSALQHVVRGHRNNRAALATARGVLDKLGPLPNYKEAIKAEVLFGRLAIHQVKSAADLSADPDEMGFDGTLEDRALAMALRNPQVRRAFETKLVAAYNDLIAALPDDPSEWKRAAQASAEFEQKVERDRNLLNSMNRLLFPTFSGAADSIGNLMAQRNLARSTLALLQMQLTSGLPEELPRRAPFMDPFSEEQLQYRREGKGFVIYSLGRDRVDGGGVTKPGEMQKDVVWDMR